MATKKTSSTKSTARKSTPKKPAAKKAVKKVVAKAPTKPEAARKYTLEMTAQNVNRTLAFSTAKARDSAYKSLQIRSLFAGNPSQPRPLQLETLDGTVSVKTLQSVTK